jgi:hypothetical protein
LVDAEPSHKSIADQTVIKGIKLALDTPLLGRLANSIFADVVANGGRARRNAELYSDVCNNIMNGF